MSKVTEAVPARTPGSDSGHQPIDKVADVLNVADVNVPELRTLAARFGAELVVQQPDEDIRGSYWGEREAGLIGQRVYVRADTPVHSALHELGHFVCMPPQTRACLDTNAGGDYDEENAVCYLQLILADELTGVGRTRLMLDMDTWGYTFRLGSTQAWFEHDASDAREWLRGHGLLDHANRTTWTVRQSK